MAEPLERDDGLAFYDVPGEVVARRIPRLLSERLEQRRAILATDDRLGEHREATARSGSPIGDVVVRAALLDRRRRRRSGAPRTRKPGRAAGGDDGARPSSCGGAAARSSAVDDQHDPRPSEHGLVLQPPRARQRAGHRGSGIAMAPARRSTCGEIDAEAVRRPFSSRRIRRRSPLRRLGPERCDEFELAEARADRNPDVALSRLTESFGSFCFSSSTGAKRSPCFSTRLSTFGASKTSVGAVAALGGALDLVPGQRGRDGGPLAGAQGVDGDRRLAAVVLGPVDEDLALAFGLLSSSRRPPSGVCFSSSWAIALANGSVSS